MGLVDYSESEGSASEAEAPIKPTAPKAPTSRKTFQKVVDRSKPGKIVVSLPGTTSEVPSEEPPAKRARTGPVGGGRFSGFNSFLPAPKKHNAIASAPKSSTSAEAKPRPGVNLKTSAAPGFSRDAEEDEDKEISGATGGGLSLPPPKTQAEPSIPAGQKAAEDVKLVGKPMMFRPLSVARNSNKKKVNKTPAPKPATSGAANPPAQGSSRQANGAGTTPETAPPSPPKKTSLFPMHTEEPVSTTSSATNGVYEPFFQQEPETNAYDQYAQYSAAATAATPAANDVDAIADDLQLDAAARRELFGRGGRGGRTAKNVINFNMDKEYQHNEALRASGEQQIHNPVRAIQGGKGSLRSLVSNVQNQREALEDSFAKGKLNRKEALSRYGW